MATAAKQRANVQKDLNCPHCSKPVAEKARTCPHCNGPLFHSGTENSDPVCPRCGNELTKVKAEGEDNVEMCLQCSGMWLDFQSFMRATNPLRLEKKYADAQNHWHKPEPGPVQYVSCPRCGRYMNRQNFSRISGIVIDRCRDHGVWLDSGELERIRLFIASGGLERLQDKKLEGLNDEMRELATRVRGTEFMTRLLHFWNWKRIFFGGGF